MTETDTIASKDALLADLRHGDPEGIIVTPENVFAAAAMVQADEAVMFRDGWGYLRIRAVPPV